VNDVTSPATRQERVAAFTLATFTAADRRDVGCLVLGFVIGADEDLDGAELAATAHGVRDGLRAASEAAVGRRRGPGFIPPTPPPRPSVERGGMPPKPFALSLPFADSEQKRLCGLQLN
jgi:hypothetical protein